MLVAARGWLAARLAGGAHGWLVARLVGGAAAADFGEYETCPGQLWW
eukprot:COSAG01_NODE_32049_length_587_cov_0.926230_2_plen_47_part_01